MKSLLGSTNFLVPRRPAVLRRSLWRSRREEPEDVLKDRVRSFLLADAFMTRSIRFAGTREEIRKLARVK